MRWLLQQPAKLPHLPMSGCVPLGYQAARAKSLCGMHKQLLQAGDGAVSCLLQPSLQRCKLKGYTWARMCPASDCQQVTGRLPPAGLLPPARVHEQSIFCVHFICFGTLQLRLLAAT
jgi:hypothetical protein